LEKKKKRLCAVFSRRQMAVIRPGSHFAATVIMSSSRIYKLDSFFFPQNFVFVRRGKIKSLKFHPWIQNMIYVWDRFNEALFGQESFPNTFSTLQFRRNVCNAILTKLFGFMAHLENSIFQKK
jgi:hypothetical protein